MQKNINTAPIIGFVRDAQKIEFRNTTRDVFEPEYFEYRYKIFTDITLRSFQQQTNQNFILLVLHSENMPPKYREWFLELEKNNAFLFNIFMEDTKEAFDRAISESFNFVSFENNTAVTFRVDNDDAVQNDFIEKLSFFMKSDFVGFTISFPMMHIIKRIEKDCYMLEDSYFPANAIGLSFVTSKENYKTILEIGDHDLVNNQNAMILFPKSNYGGLQTINGENAINTIDKASAKIFTKADLEKYLQQKRLVHLNVECLRIFKDENSFFKYFIEKSELLVPPIFKLIKQKSKNYFS